MARILIIRFSAIGDVAMTIPVIHSLATQWPGHQFMVLSRDTLAPLFRHMPENVLFRGVDLTGEHGGWAGLSELYRELREERFDAVADLHDVLRSKYLRWRFRLDGVRTAHVDKGRRGKRLLTRPRRKVLRPLPSSFERYADVFRRLGYSVQLSFTSLFRGVRLESRGILPDMPDKGTGRWIGIAPFAAHRGKVYPLSLQEEVIRRLSGYPGVRIFLFGGGRREREVLEGWVGRFPRVISVAGRLRMDDEVALMGRLDVMLSMDSANMHLASLAGIPVVSVWGATHPYAGFMGWGQPMDNAIQVDLPCRPCSVFGNKPCLRKDYACLCSIAPERIVERVGHVIGLEPVAL